MSRFIVIILSTVLGFSAATLPAQSDTVYIVGDQGGPGVDPWNPYPGLGTNAGQTCVRTDNMYTGLPQALPTTTLYPEDYDEEVHDVLISSTRNTGELYLSQIPSKRRDSAFQRMNFNGLWVPSSGSDGLGMTQLDLAAMFAFPLPSADAPLMITPNYQATFFDPKTDGNAPRRTLHTTGADIRWIVPLVKNKFSIDIGASALYSGDFKAKGSKAMRYPAHLAALWNVNPRLRVVLGVMYLDRNDDYNWLPMAGIIWRPNEDLSFELLTPRARIAQRVRWFGSAAGDDKSDWLYGAFEFGGGSWAYKDGNDSTYIDYRDLRASLGYERRCASGVTVGVEVGYMFKRRFKLDRPGFQFDPGESVFLRLRTAF